MHIPVLAKEVIEILNPKEGDFVFDLTLGAGGHSIEFAKKIGKNGILVGVDIDEDMISLAEQRLLNLDKEFRPKMLLVRSNFSRLDEIIEEIKRQERIEILPDIFFADLGISSYHFDWSHKGFSLNKAGPLDMRLSKDIKLTAQDVVMKFPKKKLEYIFREYGEESFAKDIAEKIINERKKKEIKTTLELAELVKDVYRSKGVFPKIHPATKVFMALRIFINNELENLETLLEKIPMYSKRGTRVGIISFHSLEDRIVKQKFKEWNKSGLGFLLVKNIITPSEEEIIINPRSRSAKFRAFCFNLS